MVRIRRLTVAALVLASGLLPASVANAGPIIEWLFPGAGQDNSYSAARYWTPGAARVVDHFHGPRLSVYPPDRHPEIPPGHIFLQYPRPAVDAAATIIEPPTPPATSRFRY